MAKVRPFNGYRAKLNNPLELGEIAAPPYDMLDEKMVDDLYAKSEYNTVRIIQNKPESTDSSNIDRHKRAKDFFNDWIKSGKFFKDEKESFYIYRQRFSVTVNGEEKVFERTGITVLIQLTDFSEGIILPHENTLSGPKQDRYDLLETIECNTGQLFGLASDNGDLYKSICNAPTVCKTGEFTDATGVLHQMEQVTDPKTISTIQEQLKDSTVIIADGHHRYETALNYYKKTKNPDAEYVMMTLVSIADPGLIIRPFHRLVKKVKESEKFTGINDLKKFFDVEELKTNSFDNIEKYMVGEFNYEMIFAESSNKKLYGLKLNDFGKTFIENNSKGQSEKLKYLNVSQINKLTVEGLMEQKLDGHILHDVMDYVNDSKVAYDNAFTKKEYIGCFFISPIKIDVIMDIVSGGERMPQKSTNFYPKLYSGLVFNKLESK